VLETELQTLLAEGRHREAATGAIDTYGPEIVGFLGALLGNASDADDAFAQACEDLWKGLPQFEGRSSMRTWMYTVARHAALRLARSPYRRANRHVGESQLDDAVARVRTATAPHLRTDVKSAFAAIRDALEPEDRALLVLRVDREMDWKDISMVLFPDEAARSAGDLTRLTARLRKRFQKVKEEVRTRAKEAGLLDA